MSIIDIDADCDWAAAWPQLKLLFTTAIGSFVSPPSEEDEEDDEEEWNDPVVVSDPVGVFWLLLPIMGSSIRWNLLDDDDDDDGIIDEADDPGDDNFLLLEE